jgi:hypothetical protein
VGQAILPAAAFLGGSLGHAQVFVLSQRRLKAGGSQDWLPRMAASRKLLGRFSGIVLAAGRRIDNPPQDTILPHKIVAAREERNG